MRPRDLEAAAFSQYCLTWLCNQPSSASRRTNRQTDRFTRTYNVQYMFLITSLLIQFVVNYFPPQMAKMKTDTIMSYQAYN
jgi:hypothetical protein